ncbi:MAG: KamA family radical SAM protein [bacterium]
MQTIEKSEQWNDWQWQSRNRITDIKKVPIYGVASERKKRILEQICSRFHMSITPYYASLINWSDPFDPLLLQAVPSIEEAILHREFTQLDPLHENKHSPTKGLIRRYKDRLLFLLTNRCALYCRYCTRKRRWSEGETLLANAEIDNALEYIREQKEIREVILSGGDPLITPLSYLEYILKSLRAIKHIDIIRIGTRAPVVIPQRINHELLRILDHYGPVWLTTQFNHPREITPESSYACDLIVRHGIPVNNQTVLLKGINDDPDIIMRLNQTLLRIKVRPYYLFQCDCVVGAEHFITSIFKGMEIMEYLRKYTSGLAIPTYALDVPGKGGKVPLVSNPIISCHDSHVVVKDNNGHSFTYKWPYKNSSSQDTL